MAIVIKAEREAEIENPILHTDDISITARWEYPGPFRNVHH